MKVLIVYPVSNEAGVLGFHPGIAILSSVLKHDNHITDLLIVESFDKKKLDKKIVEFKPELICFSVTFDQLDLSSKCTKYIHDKYNIKVIWGGYILQWILWDP